MSVVNRQTPTRVLTTLAGASVARAAVVGFARTGQSVAAVLRRRNVSVLAIEDRPVGEVHQVATDLGVDLMLAPSTAELGVALQNVAMVVVSPGVPPTHPVFSIAPEKVISEIELAYRLCDLPLVAITGTNGKTTVTSLVARMLEASGVAARAVGNIGDPFINLVDDREAVLAVCEVSSFQLAYTYTFRPFVATWLNLAEDHLDWHPDMDDYIAAKARIWKQQQPGDVMVANVDDPVVMREAAKGSGRLVTFGRNAADYLVSEGALCGPSGEKFALVAELPRHFPHDVMNALAAVATAQEAGASFEACQEVLRSPMELAHRVQLVATIAGSEYYDDSKATTPSAVIAALEGFSSVVLIAGGKNKGLDLAAIRRAVDGDLSTNLSAVIAIGEAAREVVSAFAGYRTSIATSMEDAVAQAAAAAAEGDAVLLSPGCASFDWYSSYEERGTDFQRVVHAREATAKETR